MIRRLIRALLPRRLSYRTAPPVAHPELLRHNEPVFIGSDFRDTDWMRLHHARNDNRQRQKRRPF